MLLSSSPDFPRRSLTWLTVAAGQPSISALLGPRALEGPIQSSPQAVCWGVTQGSQEETQQPSSLTWPRCYSAAAAACWEMPGLPGSLTPQQLTALSTRGSLENNLNVKAGCSGKLNWVFKKITNAFQCLPQSLPEITFSGVPISVSCLEMKGGALEHNLVIINWATYVL